MRRHIEGTSDLEPIIKWPGGKEKELHQIIEHCPQYFENFYEPFVGGGSVFMAIRAEKYFVNDFSTELISLYRAIQDTDKDFFACLDGMELTWTNAEAFSQLFYDEIAELYIPYRKDVINQEELCVRIDVFVNEHQLELSQILSGIRLDEGCFVREVKRTIKDKMKRMKKVEKERGILSEEDLRDNIETIIKGAVYMYYRGLYNNQMLDKTWQLQTSLFFFMRSYAYSGMFRFGARGNFNVPYGGIAYNSKHLTHKINYYRSCELIEHLKNAQIFNLDFERFLQENLPTENDFVFLDPPYDTEFSTYDRIEFGRNEQQRLAHYLINECQGRWMLIIKHTDFVFNLYNGHPGIYILAFDKEYVVSFMNRNNKNVKHLLITNYLNQ